MESLFFWTLIFSAAVIQGLLMAFLFLLSKKKSYLPNQYLGGFVLTFSVMLAFFLCYWHMLQYKYMHINYSLVSLPYLLGPLFFGYIQALLLNKKLNPLHFLPFISVFLIYAPFYFHSAEWKMEYFRQEINLIPFNHFINKVIGYGQFLSMAFYAFWTFKLFKQNPDYTNGKRGLWIKRLFYFFLGTVVLFIIGSLGITHFAISRIVDYILVFIMSSFAYSISTVSFLNPHLFEKKVLDKQLKYPRSSMTDQEATNIIQKIELIMKNEEPYLEESFRLEGLANLIGIPSHQLSQALNQFYQTSFTDLVNQYRIEKAKSLLSPSSLKHLTIEAIAYEVGFSSRATFYRAFKKFNGISPSAFIQQHKRGSSQDA